MITYRAALACYRHEKIQYFARLLNNASGKEFNIDGYEEYLKIVDELSNREIRILTLIDKYYKETSGESFLNSLGNKIWIGDDEPDKEYGSKFASFKESLYRQLRDDCDLTDNEISGFLIRLSRSGLYEQFDLVAGPNGSGKLTDLYYNLKALIIIEENIE